MTCVVLVLDTDEINDSLLLYVIVIACKLGSFGVLMCVQYTWHYCLFIICLYGCCLITS